MIFLTCITTICTYSTHLGDRERHHNRYPPQERIYENAEYVDLESPPRYGEDEGVYEDSPPPTGDRGSQGGNQRSGTSKMRLMSGNTSAQAPSSAPPKSLLEAAVGRPVTQRGLDSQNSQRNGNSSANQNNRRYDRDGGDEDDHMVGQTAIDMPVQYSSGNNSHHSGGSNHHQHNSATPLSMDELV